MGQMNGKGGALKCVKCVRATRLEARAERGNRCVRACGYLALAPAPLLLPPLALEPVQDAALLQLQHGRVEQRAVGGAWHALAQRSECGLVLPQHRSLPVTSSCVMPHHLAMHYSGSDLTNPDPS